ncbi:MAG: amidase, partial [Solirubrobacterales bacterium]
PAQTSLPLTQRSGLQLAAAIRAGELSSREVVEAHIARLRAVGPRINPIAVPRFEQALEEADAADARIAAAGEDEELPPYLGVPCTIKEAIAVEGMPNCAGLIQRRDHRATDTAPVAERLIGAGAIPLGLTNTSELCMWPESGNRVYGLTRNPYDPARTAGGSSGGEGAAIGSGGSPLGLGSDVGGSIRTPAAFCGIFGHKPTPGVVPNALSYPPGDGSAAERLLCTGPMTRRAEDLMPLLELLAGPDPRDDYVREVELSDPASVSIDGLEVLIGEETSYLPVSREVGEARDSAGAALERAGALLRRVPIRSMRRAYALFVTALNDGEESIEKMLADAGCEPLTLRNLFRRGGPHTAPTLMLGALERLAQLEPKGLTRRALAAGHAFAREIVETIGDGVLLHPPYPRVAPRHNAILFRPFSIAPVVVFNLAAVPVTEVPLGLGTRGLPLGVQVAAGPGRDHVSIAVAAELERALGGWVPPA